MKVRFSRRAVSDLEAIRAWSELHWGSAQATRFADGLHASIERLVKQPKLGRQRHTFAKGLRSVSYGGYAIFYMITPEGPAIVAILHERRNLAALDFADRLRDL